MTLGLHPALLTPCVQFTSLMIDCYSESLNIRITDVQRLNFEVRKVDDDVPACRTSRLDSIQWIAASSIDSIKAFCSEPEDDSCQ